MSRLSLVLENLEGLIEDRVAYWRRVYASELEEGPRRSGRGFPGSLDVGDCERPFFSKLNPEDKFYVKMFRNVEISALKYSYSSKIVIMRASGARLGAELVEKGVVRDLDDVPAALALYRIGLVDLVNESLNRMRVNIYECMSCYGLPYTGRPMCDFEAGVLQGILLKLYGSNVVKERYCWGLGYSFCGFEVLFG